MPQLRRHKAEKDEELLQLLRDRDDVEQGGRRACHSGYEASWRILVIDVRRTKGAIRGPL